MKKQDAFDAMRRQGWLSNQPDEFCTRLLTDANVRAFEPGQVVFNAADDAHSLVGVASGTLEVFVDHPQLHEQLLHISRPGTWFGQRVAYGAQPKTVRIGPRENQDIGRRDRTAENRSDDQGRATLPEVFCAAQ